MQLEVGLPLPHWYTGTISLWWLKENLWKWNERGYDTHAELRTHCHLCDACRHSDTLMLVCSSRLSLTHRLHLLCINNLYCLCYTLRVRHRLPSASCHHLVLHSSHFHSVSEITANYIHCHWTAGRCMAKRRASVEAGGVSTILHSSMRWIDVLLLYEFCRHVYCCILCSSVSSACAAPHTKVHHQPTHF